MNKSGVILRVISKEPTGRWCTEETYSQLINACLLNSLEINLDGPSECRLSDELTEALKHIFKSDSENNATVLIIDFTSFDPIEEGYHESCDSLCASLHLRLSYSADRADTPFAPFDILIIVSGFDDFLKSVTLNKILNKTCNKYGIGLIIAQITPLTSMTIISNSTRMDPRSTRNIDQFVNPGLIKEIPAISVGDEIKQSIDLIYGHFEITSIDPFHSGRTKTAHVNTLVSLERCLRKDNVLLYLQEIIEEWAGDNNFLIMPIGIQGGDLNGLVMGIVNNNSDRFGAENDLNGRKVAIVCDVLWDVYDLEEIAQSCKMRGATDVFILSFAKYKDTFLQNVSNKSIIEVDGHEFVITGCPFCKNGDEVVGENYEYLEQYLKNIKSLSPYVFWEMVSSTASAFAEGHWKSPITDYHYLHRFWCEPLFKTHGFGIALRLKNKILDTGIFREWIDAFVCPDEAQAVMLAEFVSRAFLRSTERIIKIDRKYLYKVTGTSIPVELEKHLNEVYQPDPFKGKNIVLIDQAAHHFGTLQALKNICEQLEGRILAFIVFIDRLHPSNSVSESLPSSHFISLYEWPWPPYKADQCPCANKHHK
jgi:hypoxanthine-guanine phosphoribosyltransferase